MRGRGRRRRRSKGRRRRSRWSRGEVECGGIGLRTGELRGGHSSTRGCSLGEETNQVVVTVKVV